MMSVLSISFLAPSAPGFTIRRMILQRSTALAQIRPVRAGPLHDLVGPIDSATPRSRKDVMQKMHGNSDLYEMCTIKNGVVRD
jgi:hypothetical protein